MTSLAANRVHLEDRGLLKPGFFADVVVFDPQQIRDVATFEDPNRLSVGMRYVLVNGEPVIFAGNQTRRCPVARCEDRDTRVTEICHEVSKALRNTKTSFVVRPSGGSSYQLFARSIA